MNRAMQTLMCAAVLMGLVGCGDPVVVGENPAPTPSPTPTAPTPAPEPVVLEVDAGVEDAGLAYQDDDFVELDVEHRDPFRSFAASFRQVATGRDVETVHSIMSTSTIDEMRLIAIISGVVRPRAMLLDGEGVGHTVERGDYIGRPEVIQVGGADSMPVPLHWRVARIRSGEVVLTRDDPTAPDRPPLTRVLPLYEEGEDPVEMRRRALERERERLEASGEGASARPPPGAPPQTTQQTL